jgi:hypothetical protein
LAKKAFPLSAKRCKFIKFRPAGGIVTIAIGIASYFAVNGLIVLFLRFANQRDEMMHAITSEWIEETHHA